MTLYNQGALKINLPLEDKGTNKVDKVKRIEVHGRSHINLNIFCSFIFHSQQQPSVYSFIHINLNC